MPGNLPEDYGTSTELAPYAEQKKEEKQKPKKEKGPSAAERLAGASGAAVNAVKSKLKRDKKENDDMELNSVLDLHREMVSTMQKDQEGVRAAEKENRRLLASTLKTLDTLREEIEASTEAFEEAARKSKRVHEMLEEHLLDAVQARQGTTYVGWVLDAVKIGLGIFACFKLGQIATRLGNPYTNPQFQPHFQPHTLPQTNALPSPIPNVS